METLIESQSKIASPCFSNDGKLYFCSPETGDISVVEDDDVSVVGNTKGAPNCVCFNADDRMYVCDFARQAILTLDQNTGELTEEISEYENRQLRGPNQLVFDKNGVMFFTDSGHIGETSIQNPKGSVFCLNGDQIQPLAYECLAYPSGIALSPKEDIVYVAETMMNRVLRFVQKPAGVYHCSVFHQFSGGLGPMALACDSSGLLYVSNFDFTEAGQEGEANVGQITVLKPNGKLHSTIRVNGTEINGLMFDWEKKNLYISENTFRTLSKATINPAQK
ncbi:beta-lactamase domain-containing proteinonase [Acrasis kona]|uniref:Beta-lactamase domain-containing proteinonase n=1 Tax=Acrasis kona TaxID=1008807 RepID=A0AAW2ZDQ3_9EUKA